MAATEGRAQSSAALPHIDIETLALRATTFVTSLAAAIFVAANLGLPLWAAYLAAAAPAAAVAALVTGRGGGGDPRSALAAWAVFAVGGLWVLLLFIDGAALPPGDPIAVPQLARGVAAGLLPSEAFSAGNSGHAYPPGYPILFAPVVLALSPLTALAAFKVATLLSVALIPAAWAWLHVRLFGSREGFPLVLGAAYVAFFVLERTLGFVAPFAGKNAVLAGLLLFPGVILAVLGLCRRRFAWPLAALPLYGLVLIHYTMLHLGAAFLVGYFLVTLGRTPTLWMTALRIAAVGLLTAGLVLLLNREVLADSRAGSFVFQPLSGALEVVKALIRAQPGFVVFTGTDVIPPAPFRGVVLLACCGLCLLADRLERDGLGRAAIAYLVALLCSLAFGMGVVPGGVKLDFVRWFAWPLQAGVFLCAAVAIVALWRRADPRRRWLWWAPAVGVACAALVSLLADARPERGFFRAVSPRRGDLEAVAARLPTAPGPQTCAMIGDSIVDPAGGVVIQRSGAWNYAEAISPCRYLNGSWMQAGAPAGRAVGGYPSAAVLRALPGSSQLFFIGRPAAFAAYRRYLAREGLAWSWTRLGGAPPDGAVWRTVAVALQPQPDVRRRDLQRVDS